MIKPERGSEELRPMLYVPGGMVRPPATNSKAIVTLTLPASWAWALMPNPSRLARVRTTVKHDFFMMSPLLNVVNSSLSITTLEGVYSTCISSVGCQMLFTNHYELDATPDDKMRARCQRFVNVLSIRCRKTGVAISLPVYWRILRCAVLPGITLDHALLRSHSLVRGPLSSGDEWVAWQN